MMRIVWSISAKNAYRQTLAFWMQNNGTDDYAIAIHKQVDSYLSILKKFPELGSIISSKYNYRRIVILKSYSIYYRIKKENNTIRILAFKDNRSNPDNLNISLI
jgi:hypothetical protein